MCRSSAERFVASSRPESSRQNICRANREDIERARPPFCGGAGKQRCTRASQVETGLNGLLCGFDGPRWLFERDSWHETVARNVSSKTWHYVGDCSSRGRDRQVTRFTQRNKSFERALLGRSSAQVHRVPPRDPYLPKTSSTCQLILLAALNLALPRNHHFPLSLIFSSGFHISSSNTSLSLSLPLYKSCPRSVSRAINCRYELRGEGEGCQNVSRVPTYGVHVARRLANCSRQRGGKSSGPHWHE